VTDISSSEIGVEAKCADANIYNGSMVLGADGVQTPGLLRSSALAADSTADGIPSTPLRPNIILLMVQFPRHSARPSECGQSFDTHHKGRSVMYITGQDHGWIFLYERLPQLTQERIFYTEKRYRSLSRRILEIFDCR
jgi:hypothetical protein